MRVVIPRLDFKRDTYDGRPSLRIHTMVNGDKRHVRLAEELIRVAPIEMASIRELRHQGNSVDLTHCVMWYPPALNLGRSDSHYVFITRHVDAADQGHIMMRNGIEGLEIQVHGTWSPRFRRQLREHAKPLTLD